MPQSQPSYIIALFSCSCYPDIDALEDDSHIIYCVNSLTSDKFKLLSTHRRHINLLMVVGQIYGRVYHCGEERVIAEGGCGISDSIISRAITFGISFCVCQV